MATDVRRRPSSSVVVRRRPSSSVVVLLRRTARVGPRQRSPPGGAGQVTRARALVPLRPAPGGAGAFAPSARGTGALTGQQPANASHCHVVGPASGWSWQDSHGPEGRPPDVMTPRWCRSTTILQPWQAGRQEGDDPTEGMHDDRRRPRSIMTPQSAHPRHQGKTPRGLGRPTKGRGPCGDPVVRHSPYGPQGAPT